MDLSNAIDNPFGDTSNNEDFKTYFNLNNENVPDSRLAIIVVYFSMTSLSTVGFGDFSPRSDGERIVCAVALLFGVAIFSYIMGNLITILEHNLLCHQGLDDGDNLSKFFGCLRRFNNNKCIN